MGDFFGGFITALAKMDYSNPVSFMAIQATIITLMLAYVIRFILKPMRSIDEQQAEAVKDLTARLEAISGEMVHLKKLSNLMRDDFDHIVTDSVGRHNDDSARRHEAAVVSFDAIKDSLTSLATNTQTVEKEIAKEIAEAVSRLSHIIEQHRTEVARVTDKSEANERRILENISAIKSEVRHLSQLVQTATFMSQHLK